MGGWDLDHLRLKIGQPCSLGFYGAMSVCVCVKYEGRFLSILLHSLPIVMPLIKVILFTGTQLAPATFH